MDTVKKLECIYLRCNRCFFGHLEEVYDIESVNGFRYKFNEYLKCGNCGKTFKGYEYELDDEDNIINFKLIEE